MGTNKLERDSVDWMASAADKLLIQLWTSDIRKEKTSLHICVRA